MKKPNFITVSAKQGDPSILWVGASGRYYRSKAQAKTDNPLEAYPYKKPFNVALWTGVLVLCIVGAAIFIYIKRKKQ